MPDSRDTSVNVFVVDRNEVPIPNATVEAAESGKTFVRASTRHFRNTPIRFVLPQEFETVDLTATVGRYQKKTTVPATVGNYTFVFEEITMPQPKKWEKIAAFAFGVAFVIVLLAIALFVPRPTDFQFWVFRVVLSLAAAGIGAVLPGFITVDVKPYVRAGGALALFVLVYWFNPPKLVIQSDGPVDPSVTVNLPDNTTLKSAILVLVENDHSTVNFKSSCPDSLLTTKVRGGIVRARDTVGLIEQLNYRLIGPADDLTIHAAKNGDGGIYEIDCRAQK